MPYKNKEDRLNYQREYRKQNREKVNSYGQYRQAERRKRNREILHAAKNKPCADCGIQYPYYVMDFDHVRGEKLFNLSAMTSQGYSVEKIQQEIDKCEVVCANCHRERTYST